MASIPRRRAGVRARRLSEIPGIVRRCARPSPAAPSRPRCGFATERCRREAPPLMSYGAHLVACWEAERVLAT